MIKCREVTIDVGCCVGQEIVEGDEEEGRRKEETS